MRVHKWKTTWKSVSKSCSWTSATAPWHPCPTCDLCRPIWRRCPRVLTEWRSPSWPQRETSGTGKAIDLFVLNTGFETVLHVRKKGQFHLGYETVTEVLLTNGSCRPMVNLNLLLLEQKLAKLKSKTD
ncbi:uncharacterized protein LOC144173524 [Haemaphysalis longicornis]